MALPSFRTVDPGTERLYREDWFISTAPRFPGPPNIMVSTEGGPVLGIGIDWAEDFHDIALGTQEKINAVVIATRQARSA